MREEFLHVPLCNGREFLTPVPGLAESWTGCWHLLEKQRGSGGGISTPALSPLHTSWHAQFPSPLPAEHHRQDTYDHDQASGLWAASVSSHQSFSFSTARAAFMPLPWSPVSLESLSRLFSVTSERWMTLPLGNQEVASPTDSKHAPLTGLFRWQGFLSEAFG